MESTRTIGGTGMADAGAKSAVEWLVSVAPEPESCRCEWERNLLGVTLLPAGRLWDVLILTGELGYPTLDVLTRMMDRPGPVLADFGDSRMGFFVPPPRAGSPPALARPAPAPGSSSPTPVGPPAGCGGWSRRTAPGI
jgi:hypothetical protein